MRNLIWLLLLALAPAQAANIDARLAKVDVCGRYEIIHINGVVTSPAGAQDNLDSACAPHTATRTTVI